MWVFGIIGFILFIPRSDRRKGLLSLLVFQAFIWTCDMPAFSYGWLSAPVRIFPKASDLTITINYFFYPVLFSIYYVHKRTKNSLWARFLYYFVGSRVSLYMILFWKDTLIY
ncbi:CBO0543 family protein [Neobacillus dielmonensis]|uniref:CBO0543 family protein n=1 Tax=Neobacillus dielmonensis TaxID=1347369 RepID=UPI0029E7E86B|nr:CBO0543 family protein [Neobacillus dielmonensis]